MDLPGRQDDLSLQGRNFAPDQTVAIAVTFTSVGDQTFMRTMSTASNGFFGTGDQLHCDFQRAITVTVRRARPLTTTGC